MATLLNIKRVRIIAAQLKALGVAESAVKPLSKWADDEEASLREIELRKQAEARQAAPAEEVETEPGAEAVKLDSSTEGLPVEVDETVREDLAKTKPELEAEPEAGHMEEANAATGGYVAPAKRSNKRRR